VVLQCSAEMLQLQSLSLQSPCQTYYSRVRSCSAQSAAHLAVHCAANLGGQAGCVAQLAAISAEAAAAAAWVSIRYFDRNASVH
jgi:hypothetical protein